MTVVPQPVVSIASIDLQWDRLFCSLPEFD